MRIFGTGRVLWRRRGCASYGVAISRMSRNVPPLLTFGDRPDSTGGRAQERVAGFRSVQRADAAAQNVPRCPTAARSLSEPAAAGRGDADDVAGAEMES